MAEHLVDDAKSMVPMILSSLDRIDSERQIPHDLASAMAEKQLFSLYAPRNWGGRRRTRSPLFGWSRR